MIRVLAFAAALALSATAASAAGPYKLDGAGKCHDAKGAFAKADMCKASAPAAAGKCRDKTTKKFAKCTAPNVEAIPRS